ncbi:hypothetical protein V8F20_012349 [Naviculisporaceae sp. PSN 640]
MHFQTLPLAITAALSFLTAPVIAQSYQQEATGTGYFRTIPTTGSIPTATPTVASGLPGLVSQLPTCALPCFESAAKTVKCTLSDFECLCQSSNLNSFALNMGTCLTGGLGADGGPSAEDDRCSISNLSSLATQICSRVNSAPSQDELASASAVVSEKLAAATATQTGATSTGTPKNEAGARKNDGAAMGMLAVVAAYAVLAL